MLWRKKCYDIYIYVGTSILYIFQKGSKSLVLTDHLIKNNLHVSNDKKPASYWNQFLFI